MVDIERKKNLTLLDRLSTMKSFIKEKTKKRSYKYNHRLLWNSREKGTYVRAKHGELK
jgi:hypothetical protein